ncbi:MAG: GntR family transcriptional regulator [Rhodothermales bacterium]|nr:GntR family transcriptional regulator [Rhodothermales bacterium]
MIQLDRKSDRSAQQQIADYFRFEIGLGRRIQIGDMLPSTRSLAASSGVSYHTVRKAYQLLESEGLLESVSGSGYRVVARAGLDSSGRLEKAAAIVSESIKRLIALGLDIADVEYILEEQLGFFTHDQVAQKILVVGPYSEYASAIASALSSLALMNVEHCAENEIQNHADADYVLVPLRMVRSVGFALSKSEILAIDTTLPIEAIEAVAKLLDYESLGLLTAQPDAIAPLTKLLKERTAFAGQIIASTTDATRGKVVETFVSQVDLLLYTPGARNIVARHVDRREVPTYEIVEMLTQESLEKVKQAITG